MDRGKEEGRVVSLFVLDYTMFVHFDDDDDDDDVERGVW